MHISLHQAGKRFNRQWVFRHISADLQEANAYAITGGNGSGKSTLLQSLFSYHTLSEGKVSYQHNGIEIAQNQVYEHAVIAAPYLDLPEELTLSEVMDFHFTFKKRLNALPNAEIARLCGLVAHQSKQVRHFSSGMKQRLKLALAFFSDVPLLLLDEPCTNLDRSGIDWYRETILPMRQQRLIVIASNQPEEYDFCDHVIDLQNFM